MPIDDARPRPSTTASRCVLPEQVFGGLGRARCRDRHAVHRSPSDRPPRGRARRAALPSRCPACVDDQARSPLLRASSTTSVGGARARGDDQARHTGLKRHRLRAHPVPHDQRVSGAQAAPRRLRLGVHRCSTPPVSSASGSPASNSPSSTFAKRPTDTGIFGEAGDLRLVEIAFGEHALADEPEQRPAAHRSTGSARTSCSRMSRPASSIGCSGATVTTCSVITSRTRVCTCAISSGSWTPNRSNTHIVSWGMRTEPGGHVRRRPGR